MWRRARRCRARSWNITTRTTSSRIRWSPRSISPPSGWASPQDLDDIFNLALRVNDYLSGLFLGAGLRLVDFKVEFGRLYSQEDVRIVLADEVSPDSCRLWDARTNRILDKDRFRRDLGEVAEGLPGGRAPTRHPAGKRRRHAAQGQRMKARVVVMPRAGVLDPQGKAVAAALAGLGFGSVEAARQGKVIELDLAASDPAGRRSRTRRHVRAAARQSGDRGLHDRNRMRAVVIVFPGSNCDRDARVALEAATGRAPRHGLARRGRAAAGRSGGAAGRLLLGATICVRAPWRRARRSCAPSWRPRKPACACSASATASRC